MSVRGVKLYLEKFEMGRCCSEYLRVFERAIALRGRRRNFFFSSRSRHTRCGRDWSSDVCSSDLYAAPINYISSPRAVRESRLVYLNGGIKVGLDLFRGVRIDTRLRAASVAYPAQDVKLAEGATLMDVTSDPTATMVPKPGKEGTDVSHEIDFTIDRRANWYGVQTGYKYAVSY